MERLDIEPDDEHINKLTKLASRVRERPDIVARTLLNAALDDADSDPAQMVETLDGIPGAYERALQGFTQAQSGETVTLRDL